MSGNLCPGLSFGPPLIIRRQFICQQKEVCMTNAPKQAWTGGLSMPSGPTHIFGHNLTKNVYYKYFLSTATAHWSTFLKEIGLIQ